MKKIIGLILISLILVSGCTKLNNETNTTQTTTTTIKEEVNEIIIDKMFVFDTHPQSFSAELETGKYYVYFETDKPVQFIMYDEMHYNQWLTNYYGKSKINTKSGNNCCATTGSWNVDINNGEEGKYYFVFDDKNQKNKPTGGKLLVKKILIL